MSLSSTLTQIEKAQQNLVKELFREIPHLQRFSFYRADSVGIVMTINNLAALPWDLSQVSTILYYNDKELKSPSMKSWFIEQDLKLSDLVLIARVITQLQQDLTLQYIAKEYLRKNYE